MSLEAAIAENTRALQALLAHLQAQPIAVPAAPAPAVEPAPKARKAKAEPAVEPAPEPAVEPKPEPKPEPVPPRSLPQDKDEVAALVSACINKGLKAQARALFDKIKAPNISGVPAEKLPALADDLRALLATVSE